MEDKECLICYDTINQDELFETKCNHLYHRNCIQTFCKKKNNLECPYCRILMSNTWNIFEKICSWIFKVGKNKGNKCSYTCFDNKYCLMHHKSYYRQKEKEEEKQKIKEQKEKEKHNCSFVLLKGKNKGLYCSKNGINKIDDKYFCKVHTPTTNNTTTNDTNLIVN